MKVLVTGAGGYIGTVLVNELLKKGYYVAALDRWFFGKTLQEDVNLKVIDADERLYDPNILRGIDAVIDLASLSNDPSGELDPVKTWSINYLGRLRTAILAKHKSVKRYLLSSSCSVYGFRDDIANESSQPNPLTTYAKANVYAERDILPLADKDFTPMAFRIATVYGYGNTKRMRFDLVINAMTRDAVTKGKIMIMRDGTQWRPFVDVRDVAAAFAEALERPEDLIKGKVFNLGSDDQNYQIKELADRITSTLGIKAEYEWYGSPDTRSYKVTFERLKKEFKFEPKYRVEDGARDIADAIKNNKLDPNNPKYITVSWYKSLIAQGVMV